MKIGQRSLLGYLPAQVIKCVLDGTISQKPRYPLEIPLNTVSLFADISGFTKLSEKFSKKGRTGPEFLAFCLNRYMELLIIKTNYKKLNLIINLLAKINLILFL